MFLLEILDTKNKSIIGLAREITSLWDRRPVSQRQWKQLAELSKDGWLMNQLFRHSQRMNHRAPLDTDHMLLTDAGTCAKAYTILNQVQERSQLH